MSPFDLRGPEFLLFYLIMGTLVVTLLFMLRQLIDPNMLCIRLGLNTPPPSLDELFRINSLEIAARRVMASIIFHGWQRFRALRLVELQHFEVSPHFLEVIIPDDKTGTKMSRLPLDRLAPGSELQDCLGLL